MGFWTVRGAGAKRRGLFPRPHRGHSRRQWHEWRQRHPVGISRLFRKHGHEIVPSSPLVPRNDPTLMFTNAGMVQFKNVFTGVESRPIPRRDLAEMRARRRQAQRSRQCRLHRAPPHLLRDARQFLLRRLFQGRGDRARLEPDHQGIRAPRRRLLVTVYHTDDEAADLWKKIAGLPDDRIIRIATSDNFWAMGDTGPCGPCSEIFYDHGEGIPGGPPGSPDEDGDRFIEIWNLVFMQYEQVDEGGARRACPSPPSTPAWGSSASPPCCRASTTITTSTCSRR
jgi:alanyl-tRNA synthetase